MLLLLFSICGKCKGPPPPPSLLTAPPVTCDSPHLRHSAMHTYLFIELPNFVNFLFQLPFAFVWLQEKRDKPVVTASNLVFVSYILYLLLPPRNNYRRAPPRESLTKVRLISALLALVVFNEARNTKPTLKRGAPFVKVTYSNWVA